MKKILAVFLSLAMIMSVCAFGTSASDLIDKKDITKYPVIIVPGYSSSALYMGDSPETGEQVWGLDMDEVLDRVVNRLVDLGVGLGALTVGNAEIIAKTLGEEINGIFEKMRCAPDGSSVYPLKRIIDNGADGNNAVLMERYPNGEHRQEQDIAEEIAKYVGHENIYNFACDFRMGTEFCARQLDAYIQTVKEHSGKDKVNIFAVSHGGQTTATYLTLFGYKNDVDNAVLTIPAIGGAGIAYDAMTNQVDFDEECLIRFIEHGTCTEEDYNWLVKAQQLGFIDSIFEELIPEIFPTVGYWGSLWDFIPLDKYEDTKKMLLDYDESAPLIEKSDRFHYEIYPKIEQKLAECIENGMNISIIAGTGNRIVTGLMEDSDGIITTAASTGATTAPYGQRFADGYVQIEKCGGKNKVSPDMKIDASTGYIPDNTWYVNGLFHGMTFWDYYSRNLMMTLLLSDNITDVYSDSAYPQFRDTSNPSSSVYAQFKGCQPGEVCGETNTLVVTNCCWENDVRLSAIVCDGLDIEFKVNPFEKLEPGESVELEFEGEIPEVSAKLASVTVYYTMGTVTPVGYRTQYFTIDNGEAVAESDELVSAEAETPFDSVIGDFSDNILRSLGLKELFSMYFNIIFYWVNTIFGI